jgi:glutaredoxin-related protein
MRQRFGGGAAPEIMRAMENLKAALRLRMQRGQPEDVSKITAVLDAAARSIETM